MRTKGRKAGAGRTWLGIRRSRIPREANRLCSEGTASEEEACAASSRVALLQWSGVDISICFHIIGNPHRLLGVIHLRVYVYNIFSSISYHLCSMQFLTRNDYLSRIESTYLDEKNADMERRQGGRE